MTDQDENPPKELLVGSTKFIYTKYETEKGAQEFFTLDGKTNKDLEF